MVFKDSIQLQQFCDSMNYWQSTCARICTIQEQAHNPFMQELVLVEEQCIHLL